MRWVCTGLLGLCACDALFGLDHIETNPADAAIDAAPLVTITGSLVREYLHLDASGAPTIETVPYQPGITPLTVTRDDGSLAPLTWDPLTGAFSFGVAPGERYAIAVDGCGGVREYQLTSQQVALVDSCLGRPDQIAPYSTTRLEFDLPAPIGVADGAVIASAGVWSAIAVTSATSNYSVAWPMAGFGQNQAPALLSTAGHDSAYFLDYAPVANVPPYRVLGSMIKANVDLGPGTIVVSAMPAPVSRTSCVDAYYNRASEYARLHARYPGFTTGDAGGTVLFSAPLPSHGLNAFYELASTGDQQDNHVPMQYGTPFTGHDVLLFDSAYVARRSHGLDLLGFSGSWDRITPAGGCAAHLPLPRASLPYGARLANIPLADDIVVGIAADKPVELSWSIEAGDVPPAFTNVRLHRPDNSIVREYRTTGQSVRIDPAILDAGSYYTAEIVLNGAVPTAAAGDFTVTASSFSFSVAETPFFTVSK